MQELFSQWCQQFFRLCKLPRFWIAIALFFASFLVTIGPLNFLLNQEFIINFLETYQGYAIALFIVLYAVLTVLGIPGMILSIAGGVTFGLLVGTLLSAIGATIGALGAFLTARYLIGDWFETKFQNHRLLTYLNQAVQHNPLQFVLTIRFIPITPFNLINFLFGLTSIHWLPYTVATFFGILPGTFAYTWLGVSGMDALQGRDRVSFFFALALLALLSAIPLFFKNKQSYNKPHS